MHAAKIAFFHINAFIHYIASSFFPSTNQLLTYETSYLI